MQRAHRLDPHISGDSWMHPHPNVPRHGKSLYKPYIYSGYLWVIIPKNPHNKYHGYTVRDTTNCPMNIARLYSISFFQSIKNGSFPANVELFNISSVPGGQEIPTLQLLKNNQKKTRKKNINPFSI